MRVLDLPACGIEDAKTYGTFAHTLAPMGVSKGKSALKGDQQVNRGPVGIFCIHYATIAEMGSEEAYSGM